MDKTAVVLGALVLIGLVTRWFFGKHETSEIEAHVSSGTQEVTVTVNGGYTPNTVVLKQGVPAKIIFDRKDPSSCFNEVVFPDFGLHEALLVGKKYAIDIDTSKSGEYRYTCGMNMFDGKVVIK